MGLTWPVVMEELLLDLLLEKTLLPAGQAVLIAPIGPLLALAMITSVLPLRVLVEPEAPGFTPLLLKVVERQPM